MTLEELLKGCNVIELAEDVQEDDGAVRAVFRTKPKMDKHWTRLMVDMLTAASEDEEYGLEPQKVFFYDDDKMAVRFLWVLVIWGDLERAAEDLKPMLQKEYGRKPKKPKSTQGPVLASTLRRSVSVSPEGARTVKTRVSVSHGKSGRYDGDPHEVVKVKDAAGRFGAVSQTLNQGFTPKKENL